MILLEAELDKVKALHRQEMKNMEERVQFAEEREKKARATKEQLIEIIRTFEGNDKNKFNQDLAGLKTFYEEMLEDLKAEFEEDIGRYKDQILDLEAQLRTKVNTEHHSHIIMAPDSSVLITELKEKISLLERENSNLRLELDKKRDSANPSVQEAKYLELIADLKNENKSTLRASQVDHNDNISKLVSDYERKIAELKALKTPPAQPECPNCGSDTRSSLRRFETAQMSEVQQLDMYLKLSNQDKTELERMKGDIKNLRVSVQQCERRLCESISVPVIPSPSMISAKKRSRRDDLFLHADNKDSQEPKVNNFSIDVMPYGMDGLDELNDSTGEYNPLPFKEEALYENSKNKYSYRTFNKTPHREMRPKHGQPDTISKSMVKFIESDNKEADGGNQRPLREISNIPCFAQRLASQNEELPVAMASLPVPGRQYGYQQREPLHKMKELMPREPKMSDRSYTSKSMQDSEEEQMLMLNHLSALLHKVDRSRGHSRPHLNSSQLNRSRTPTRDLNESRWGGNDRGFLNFYKENWHSSAFALEDD